MSFTIDCLYELLAENDKAYIKASSLMHRQHPYNTWVSLYISAKSEPSEAYNILVEYADLPGFNLTFLSELAIEQANDKILNMSKTLHYDLVKHHLRIRPGSILPVLNITEHSFSLKYNLKTA